MSPVSCALLGETLESLIADRDAILGAIDIILHGYSVGIPRWRFFRHVPSVLVRAHVRQRPRIERRRVDETAFVDS